MRVWGLVFEFLGMVKRYLYFKCLSFGWFGKCWNCYCLGWGAIGIMGEEFGVFGREVRISGLRDLSFWFFFTKDLFLIE